MPCERYDLIQEGLAEVHFLHQRHIVGLELTDDTREAPDQVVTNQCVLELVRDEVPFGVVEKFEEVGG